MERAVHTLRELEQEADGFLATLSSSEDRATLVALRGELGAGKTAFTKALAKALGVEEAVTSPTFVLQKTYPLSGTHGFSSLVHIDAYRLKDETELAGIGFTDTLASPRTLVCVEWPEQVAKGLPTPEVTVSLKAMPDGSRTIVYAR